MDATGNSRGDGMERSLDALPFHLRGDMRAAFESEADLRHRDLERHLIPGRASEDQASGGDLTNDLEVRVDGDRLEKHGRSQRSWRRAAEDPADELSLAALRVLLEDDVTLPRSAERAELDQRSAKPDDEVMVRHCWQGSCGKLQFWSSGSAL